ncbi:MAG: hypothetical protein JOY58_20850 [Solirubrobacterales bacterium]|nr:hypothetical protein [Solirubrobacterales bacterium]MBV9050724.1 hypothetical protein [Solirubrobacterales bacterium]
MLLALAATALVAIALLSDLILPRLEELWQRSRARRERIPTTLYDPGRERRAEQRARTLLRSCVNEEEWAMYRDLGFIRVWGSQADGPDEAGGTGGAPYAYLIYPHRPIVAYLAQTHRLLNEYCVTFPDETRPFGSARLPDSDDVLAKWMALTGDEGRLISTANMHLPGRQLDPADVRRDLWRLGQWERARMRAGARGSSARVDSAG